MIERRRGIRYVAPLREGGSLPAIVDTDPAGRYVVKFRGAGQGPKALVAEMIAAGLATALGLPIPAVAVVDLPDGFGAGEPDGEIQDLLRASVGENFALAYLPGAIGFDAAVDLIQVSPELAAQIVWFDALITNPDRTIRNPNLLRWEGKTWLIDHGAALYFHHRWAGWERRGQSDFPQIRDHVLLRRAGSLEDADAQLRSCLDETRIRAIVEDIPDEWLSVEPHFADLASHREAYITYLMTRLSDPREWLTKAIDVRRGF